VAALFLGGVGLACASVSALQWFALLLPAAGLAVGVYRTLVQPPERLRDVIVLRAGTIISAGTVVCVLFWPNFLGMESLFAGRSVPEPERNRQVFQPRTDRAGVEDTPQPVAARQWVDAERYEIDHGVVRLRVVRVIVKDLPPAKGKKSQQTLLVTVDLAHVGTHTAVTLHGWTKNAMPQLTDAGGQAYMFQGATGEPAVRPISLRPLVPIRETLTFEAPPIIREPLRLELPAAAFGGEGAIRYEIPRRLESP
jgi:hypothetical protein